jgi:hypothetical protein
MNVTLWKYLTARLHELFHPNWSLESSFSTILTGLSSPLRPALPVTFQNWNETSETSNWIIKYVALCRRVGDSTEQCAINWEDVRLGPERKCESPGVLPRHRNFHLKLSRTTDITNQLQSPTATRKRTQTYDSTSLGPSASKPDYPKGPLFLIFLKLIRLQWSMLN